MGFIAETARRAAEDAGITLQQLADVDLVAVAEVIAWRAQNPADLLAQELGAKPRQQLSTHTSGSSPQTLVNEVARRLAAGQARLALISGAEILRTRRLARKQQLELDWDIGGEGTPEMLIDPKLGFTPQELAHGLALAPVVFSLIGNAYRAERGWSPDEHRRRLGELCAGLNAVAADNPLAWFPKRRGAEEIATPSADNRPITLPYTKYMCAVMEVDQASSLLMTTVGTARELGIPEERWVYFLGGATAVEEPWFLTPRTSLTTSTSLRSAGQTALRRAGLEISDIDLLDLYSCFPSSVEIAENMLGIPEDDPRPRSVTGGLAYFGGPGSNYSAHAIATLVQQLRERPGRHGLVHGMGWWLARNAVGIYSSAPPNERADFHAPVVEVAPQPARPVNEQPSGAGRIDSYTLTYDREGNPNRGIVLGQTEAGEGFVANLPPEVDLLQSAEREDWIGRSGKLNQVDELNRFEPS